MNYYYLLLFIIIYYYYYYILCILSLYIYVTTNRLWRFPKTVVPQDFLGFNTQSWPNDLDDFVGIPISRKLHTPYYTLWLCQNSY